MCFVFSCKGRYIFLKCQRKVKKTAVLILGMCENIRMRFTASSAAAIPESKDLK